MKRRTDLNPNQTVYRTDFGGGEGHQPEKDPFFVCDHT